MQEFITPPNHNHTHSDNHIFIVVDGEGNVYAADVKEVKELMKKVCRSKVLTGHTNGFSRNTSTPYNLNPVCKLSFQQSY